MTDTSAGSNHQPPARRLEGPELLRDLERRFRSTNDPVERAQLADRLVPELLSNNAAGRAAAALAGLEHYVADPDQRARLLALRAVVSAMRGESPAPDIATVLELLPGRDGRTAAVVRHRAGVASFYARAALEAEEHSLAALSLCERYGLRWLAARTASTLYGVHYHLTGDLHAARYYAELTTSQADAAGDAAMRRAYLCAQFDLACAFADWDRAGSLRELVRRERGAEHYATGVPTRIGDALLLGRCGDFTAMLGRLEATLAGELHPVDRALVFALAGLARAALGLRNEARSAGRQALGLSNAARGSEEFVHLTTRRRLGGVLAAWVSVIAGDSYHGRRALAVRSKWPGHAGSLAAALDAEAGGYPFDPQNPSLAPIRGYLIVAQRARAGYTAFATAAPFALTATEIDVLRAVAQGKSNATIALERGVTRNAVERRLMSAYVKLDVATRGQAIAKIARIL